ncbi:MAG: tRNA (pseudouridine(54)-N(1))-methyltransferase TrmY [Nanopusillaceae archaeon]
MRIFILYSNSVRTDGNFKNIYYSGRLDVLVHSIIHAFFISNGLRKNIEFNIVLNGPPDPPRRIKIESNIETPWSKKDVTTLLSSSLKKFNKKKMPIYTFPGVFVEKKGFRELVEEYINQGRKIYVLEKNGMEIGNIKIENPVFIIGDFLGIPKDEKKWLKDISTFISLGDIPYFTSQVICVLNWYLDNLNYYKDFWDTGFKFQELKKKINV